MPYKFNPFTSTFDQIGVQSLDGLSGIVFLEGTNVGTGVPLFYQNSIVGNEILFEFRGLTSSDNSITITDNGTEVDLSAGNVVGPASSTDNAIARFDGTTGKLIQDSLVTIADTTGTVSTPGGFVSNNTPGTYTASLPTGLSQAGSFTLNFATPTAPAVVGDTTTINMSQSQSPSLGGALFAAFNTLKNTSGVAANLGPYYALVAATTFTADTASITQPASFPIFVNNTFNTSGGGTLATSQFSGLKIAGSVDSGVTITEWRGIEVNSPTNTGTITTLYGMKIDPITTGSTNYGLAIGESGTQTLWINNTSDSTTSSGGIAFGTSKDTLLYRLSASKLKTTGAFELGGAVASDVQLRLRVPYLATKNAMEVLNYASSQLFRITRTGDVTIGDNTGSVIADLEVNYASTSPSSDQYPAFAANNSATYSGGTTVNAQFAAKAGGVDARFIAANSSTYRGVYFSALPDANYWPIKFRTGYIEAMYIDPHPTRATKFTFNGANGQTTNYIDVVSYGGTTLISINKDGVFLPLQAPTASAPTYVKGGMYFDTTLNKLRIGGASGWETVTSV